MDCQAPNTWLGSTHFSSRFFDVAGVDLLQQAVALAGVAARVREPVLRLVRRPHDAGRTSPAR